jgi:hypothetical protein
VIYTSASEATLRHTTLCLQLGLELDLIRRSLSDAQDLSGYETSCDNDLRILYRHIKGELKRDIMVGRCRCVPPACWCASLGA